MVFLGLFLVLMRERIRATPKTSMRKITRRKSHVPGGRTRSDLTRRRWTGREEDSDALGPAGDEQREGLHLKFVGEHFTIHWSVAQDEQELRSVTKNVVERHALWCERLLVDHQSKAAPVDPGVSTEVTSILHLTRHEREPERQNIGLARRR